MKLKKRNLPLVARLDMYKDFNDKKYDVVISQDRNQYCVMFTDGSVEIVDSWGAIKAYGLCDFRELKRINYED